MKSEYLAPQTKRLWIAKLFRHFRELPAGRRLVGSCHVTMISNKIYCDSTLHLPHRIQRTYVVDARKLCKFSSLTKTKQRRHRCIRFDLLGLVCFSQFYFCDSSKAAICETHARVRPDPEKFSTAFDIGIGMKQCAAKLKKSFMFYGFV